MTSTIERLGELLAKATPGNWKTGMAFPTRVIAGEGDGRSIVCGTCLPLDEGAPNEQELADAAFIAAAKTELPTLLDHIASLEGALRPLLEACEAADAAGDLSDHVAGDLMFAARQALSEPQP